ncbi:hypothetical protein FACS1894142_3700 [Spirochaetia bacterium]|nr:hypothetical protein FACS1894142_3700 [Spirochaetia bacterium]GHU58908.1 hypothetical protein FACS189444_3330 [Spirochaetia bacterium]
MKQSSFKAVCLILMMLAALAAFGDDTTVNLESIVLESFDGDSNYEWKRVASKFAAVIDGDAFPKLTYVNASPTALRQSQEDEHKSLGVWGKFDRRGYNWIDIYPVAKDGGDDAGAVEIPIPGRASELDIWIWGSNLNYYVEAYVRDYQGVVHTINLGSIAFAGWKNLRVKVPVNIPQSKRLVPRLASLKFVKFRITTLPNERVDNFYVYFDNFKVLTDTFETRFDGEELGDPDRVNELWSTNEGGV